MKLKEFYRRNNNGYCKTTACINPEYSKIYTTSKRTLRILTNEESSKIQQERDKGVRDNDCKYQ